MNRELPARRRAAPGSSRCPSPTSRSGPGRRGRRRASSAPLTQRYPTNWELSAARAINVARYLEKQGIEPTKLSAAAFGEVADNTTLEGRAKNRRIEIVLVPKE
jgi:hypothetical protein